MTIVHEIPDRCAGQKNRKRHAFATHSGEITSVNSFTLLAHGTMPESFATVQLQTCLSAEASHNVLVVDATSTVRGVFTLQSFVTVPRPPLDTTFALDVHRNAPIGLVLRAVPVTVSVAFIALQSRVRSPNQAFCIVHLINNPQSFPRARPRPWFPYRFLINYTVEKPLSRNLVHVRLKNILNNDFVQKLHLNRASATTETRLSAFRFIHSVARVACVCLAFVAVTWYFCDHLAVHHFSASRLRISWQCVVIVSCAWVSWQYCTEETSQEMIRLRGVAWDDSPAGCRIQTSLDTSLANIRLLGRTSPSIECRIQCFDYRASLASTHACFLSCFFGVSRLRGDLAMLLEARRFSSCFSWVSRLRGEASKINVRGSPALAVL